MIDIAAKVVWHGNRVVASYERGRRKVMNRSGALTRKIWRSLIRFRKRKNSEPGDPPRSHTTGFGIRSIFYDYNPRTGETIVGPVTGKVGNLPEILEFGGRSDVILPPRLQRKLGKRRLNVRVRPRPSGAPALERFVEEYPEIWKDAISG